MENLISKKIKKLKDDFAESSADYEYRHIERLIDILEDIAIKQESLENKTGTCQHNNMQKVGEVIHEANGNKSIVFVMKCYECNFIDEVQYDIPA